MELETYERERMQPTKEQLQQAQVEGAVISDVDETEKEVPKNQKEEQSTKPPRDNQEQPNIVGENQQGKDDTNQKEELVMPNVEMEALTEQVEVLTEQVEHLIQNIEEGQQL